EHPSEHSRLFGLGSWFDLGLSRFGRGLDRRNGGGGWSRRGDEGGAKRAEGQDSDRKFGHTQNGARWAGGLILLRANAPSASPQSPPAISGGAKRLLDGAIHGKKCASGRIRIPSSHYSYAELSHSPPG